MIKSRRMALKPRHGLAQACSARKLAIEQRHELALGRQLAHPMVRPIGLDQAIERAPRYMLQQAMEYAIVMPHGVDPLSCPGRRQIALDPDESTPCALSTKTQPDSSGSSPGMTMGGVYMKLAVTIVPRGSPSPRG